jgi:FAD:protein FMN transferase
MPDPNVSVALSDGGTIRMMLEGGQATFQFHFQAMGSPCAIHIAGGTEATARKAAQVAMEDIGRLEQRYSRYRPDSVLAAVNKAAHDGGRIELDEETACFYDYALACHRKSGGVFDITTGLLRKVWNFDGGSLPRQERITELLARVGMDKIEWKSPFLSFPVAGMELDLGGIVKECAADRAAEVLAALGQSSVLVDLGGDLRATGAPPGMPGWRVGIRHPRRPDTALATVDLVHAGLASSGDYERFIEVDGQRYGHILHPATGWPVRGLAAVSVIADSCLVAGSGATIAMLKERDGIPWLARQDLAHLWMDDEGRQGGPLATPPSFCTD